MPRPRAMPQLGNQVVGLSFPFLGLDESSTLGNQRRGTTPSLKNVRGFSPRTGRNCGAQRSGLSKYAASQINSSNSIQDINHVVTALANDVSAIGQSLFGRQTGAGSGSASIISTTGATVATEGTAARQYHGSVWDRSGNVYVIEENTGTLAVTIYKRTKAGADTWTVQPFSFRNTTTGCIYGMAIAGTTLYVWAFDVATIASDNTHVLLRYSTVDGSDVDASPPWQEYTDLEDPDGTVATQQTGDQHNLLAYTQGMLGMLMRKSTGNALIRVVSTATGNTLRDISLTGDNCNLPYNLIADNSGNFYAAYYTASGSDNTNYVEKVQASDGTILWTALRAGQDRMTGIAYDAKNDRLGVVGNNVVGTGHSFGILNSATGAVVTSSDYGGETDWFGIVYNGAGGFVLGRGTGTNDFSGMGEDLVEDWAIDNSTTFHPYFLSCNAFEVSFSAVAGELSLRQVRGLVVAGGTVKRFDTTGTLTALTNGSSALSSTNPVIFSTELFQDVYFADGTNEKFYDSSRDDMQTWTASAGFLPEDGEGYKPRLICTWRARIVLSGLKRDPHNWFMSAVGDPNDWDYSPETIVETQAVAGNNSAAGKVGDVINCLIPYNDDVLIFGCDHTIWQMSGDPMAGGRIDLVTDAIGMAWGRPYCKDPQGAIWFFGSRGGVFRLLPGQLPQRVSQAIEERLAEVNLNTNIVRLAWDDRQQGLHVFISPLTAATTTTHYYFDVRNANARAGVAGAWYLDVFGNANHNPKCLHLLDGDAPGDRVILLGSWDGYLRKLDIDADDDDGTAIDSYVYLGPLQDGSGQGVLLKELLATLDEDSDDVDWSVHVGSTPQQALAASATASGRFRAGGNRNQPARRHGHAIYVKLGNSTLDQTWALDSLQATLATTGAVRRRGL